MKDAEKIRILDDVVLTLEIYRERAAVMLNCIDQYYFDLNEDDDRIYYFNTARIQCDILVDYIHQMGNQLNEARKMFREWRKERERETDQQAVVTQEESGNVGPDKGIV